MIFDWDPGKCAANIRKRGLDFIDAIPAFDDPARKIWEDDRQDYGEVRYNMLTVNGRRVFFVTFILRSGVMRIVSFRKVNQREGRRYGKL